jgi:hypothetical protein
LCRLAAAEQRNGQRGLPAFQVVATVLLVAARYALQRKLVVKSMANEQDPIGYKRPPAAHRFKPGVSGNPSGRPKRVRSFEAELLDELAEVTRAGDGDGELEISKARAIAKFLVNAAVGGNMRAVSLLLSFRERIAGDNNALHGEVAVPEDAEILDNYLDRELRRRTDGCDVNTHSSQTEPHQKE